METEAGIKGDTDAGHDGDGKTTKIWCSMTCRHPGKLLAQALQQWDHQCRKKPAVQTPDRPENAACVSQHTLGSRRSDQGNCVEHCGGTRQTSVLRCEAIADHTNPQRVRESESHGTFKRLPEMASLRRVRVAPSESEQWRERVEPPELMGGSSRTVLTSKQTSQILEQIGMGAEARTTSGNSATCVACAGKQIVSVAKPDHRRIDPGGTPQERNPAEVRGHDLEQDTKTEAYTSELLTMRLRQVPQRWREGQEKA